MIPKTWFITDLFENFSSESMERFLSKFVLSIFFSLKYHLMKIDFNLSWFMKWLI